MLQLEIPLTPEEWDEEKEEFIAPKVKVLQLEHSLLSISKWESKWCKPFLSNVQKMTDEEVMDYIKFMTTTPNVSPDVYEHLTKRNVDDIISYINAPMTATTISDKTNSKGKPRIVTSELIYYWMFTLQIPMKCEKWHLNRLITLIRVFDAENKPADKKKMSQQDLYARNRAINAANKKRFNTRG